jgi:hypothetical protein
MLHVIFEPKIQRRVRIRSGDDIPAGSAAADVIERGKAARHVIGLVESGRACRDQPNVFGRAGERR